MSPHLGDIEIFRKAKVLVDTRGPKGAKNKALENMAAMLDRKDVPGIAVWRQVIRAIDELERTVPAPGERIN